MATKKKSEPKAKGDKIAVEADKLDKKVRKHG